MARTQIQFPDPLYRRLKEVARENDWSLADVVRRASELYVRRFSQIDSQDEEWTFPSVSMGGDFKIDPSKIRVEAEAFKETAVIA